MTTAEVACALRAMKDTAPGRDGIPRMAWLKLPSCHQALAEIFTFSLATGFVPQSLKLAETCPIPKPGKEGIDGFRPITLLQCAAKILERVV